MKYVIGIWVIIIIGFSFSFGTLLINISEDWEKERKCENYSEMHNLEKVHWMDGYKICFDIENGKEIKL